MSSLTNASNTIDKDVEGQDGDASGIRGNLWEVVGGQTLRSPIDKIEEARNQCEGLQAGGEKERMCRTEVCWPEISSYRRVFFNLSSSVTENSEPTHFFTAPHPLTHPSLPPHPTSASRRLFTWVLLSPHCANPLRSLGVWQLNKLGLFGERWRIFISQTPVHSGEWAAAGQTRGGKALTAPHFKRAASLWCPCHIISVCEGAAAELIKSWAFARSVAPVLLSKSESRLLGCLTSPWKAYQLVSASVYIIHELVFPNEVKSECGWWKHLHSFTVTLTRRLSFVCWSF